MCQISVIASFSSRRQNQTCRWKSEFRAKPTQYPDSEQRLSSRYSTAEREQRLYKDLKTWPAEIRVDTLVAGDFNWKRAHGRNRGNGVIGDGGTGRAIDTDVDKSEGKSRVQKEDIKLRKRDNKQIRRPNFRARCTHTREHSRSGFGFMFSSNARTLTS